MDVGGPLLKMPMQWARDGAHNARPPPSFFFFFFEGESVTKLGTYTFVQTD